MNLSLPAMGNKIKLKQIGVLIVILKLLIIGSILFKLTLSPAGSLDLSLDQTFLFFIVIGFVAQMIDGTLGMAYGVSCSTLLLSLGVPPALASASVHTAEVFTTGVSGLSHLWMQNVNKSLFLKLVIPGVLGSALGAYLIADIFDGNVIKPYVSGYLVIIGITIVLKSFYKRITEVNLKKVPLLGFTGGFFDSIGGGGWGPIVTSNLILQGKTPHETIGTVSTAEFFVTFASTGIFLLFLGITGWKIIIGLILGGIIAAPIAAIISKKVKGKIIMLCVGLLIIATSAYSIWQSINN